MNKLFPIVLVLLFSCIFIQSCTFMSSHGRSYNKALNYYNNQKYDLAISSLIESLESKPNYEKSLNLYQKVVPEAIKTHHNNINKYTVNPGFEDALVDEYHALFSLLKIIEGANINTTHLLYVLKSYEKEYSLALQNAAEFHYQNALRLISLNDKRKYREAIRELRNSSIHIKNYKDSKVLIDECKNKATFSIAVMSFENNIDSRYNNIGAVVSNKILSGLSDNSSFMEFVNIVDRDEVELIVEELKISASGLINEEDSKKPGFMKGVDHIITGDINQIIISRPKHTSQKEIIEHRVQTGYETILNEDSVEVKVPIFGSKFKEITIHQLNALSSIEVFLKIIDVSTSSVLKSKTFYSKRSYYDEWATGLDNIEPVEQFFKELKNKKRRKDILNSEELLQQAINECSSEMLESIVNFYK